MSSRRKQNRFPTGKLLYITDGITEGENELTAGKPLPPYVELTLVGPQVVEKPSGESVPTNITPSSTQDPA